MIGAEAGKEHYHVAVALRRWLVVREAHARELEHRAQRLDGEHAEVRS